MTLTRDTHDAAKARHPDGALSPLTLTWASPWRSSAPRSSWWCSTRTVVNVSVLPSIQRQLHFSSVNLEWVITGYALAFGGLLLLGGRIGDLFGRRRMFITGVLLFTTASFLGGLAPDQGWLIGARFLQGIGGAIAAPTALALIASTFPEGPSRNRAMGVYAAMSAGGGYSASSSEAS